MKSKIFILLNVLLATVALQGCKHRLAIGGEGDIVDANNSGRGCTLEQFRAHDMGCTENEVSDDYFVNYKAVPRPGWRFVRWKGPCSPKSDFQYCRLNIPKPWVVWWDETHPDVEIPPSVALFQPITGETGYLVAPAVAGVAYETPTQKGVTGLDGSFQYEEGETVRFMIGDTLLGEVTGQAQVTPFDLAGSAVATGINITWALQNDERDFLEDSEAEEYVDPFHAVVNIAVFLQTLDHDADSENGIQIRPGVASLFRRLSLNVSQHWREFQKEPTLRRAIGQANRKRRFSEPHGIVKPAAALEHLYEALAIDARTLGVSLLKSEDGDGNTQNIERFQYDANGNVARFENDTLGFEIWQYDANGNVTRHERRSEKHNVHNFETWQYDTNGNETRREDDQDADGTPERIFSSEYNADGNPTRSQYDHNADGTPDSIETWRYDAKGNVRQYREERHEDGTLKGFESWQYNVDGKVTRSESYFELSPDTTWYSIVTWRYDANGNVTQSTAEGEGPYGPGSSVTHYQYDANGNVVRIEQVDNDEDRLVQIETWQYDANSNVTRYERDYGADGTLDEIETWRYDANGNVTRHEVYGDTDGTPEEIEIWQYHANGNVRRHEFKRTSSQYPTHGESWQYQYDANGNLTRYEADSIYYNEDEDEDNMADIIQSWQYDANGNLTRAEEDSDADGRPGYIETWQYDLDGNLTRHERDENGHGAIEYVTTYQYEATGWGHLFSGVEVFGHGSLPPLKPRPNPGQLLR